MTSSNIGDVLSTKNMPINPYNSKKAGKKDGAKEDFMSLMAGSVSNSANIQISNNTTEVATKPNVSAAEAGSNQNSYNTVKDKITDKPQEQVDYESVSESVEDFVEGVKEEFAKELDVSEEELTEAMENLGLTFLDLTEPSNLSLLLGELKGTDDSVNLLLDDSVKNIFDAMGELTGELFSETGLDREGLISVVGMEPVTEEVTLDLQMTEAVNTMTNVGTDTLTDVDTEVEELDTEPDKAILSHVGEETAKPEPKVSEEQTEDSEAVNTLSQKVESTRSQQTNDNGTMSQNNNSNNQSQMASQTTETAEPVNVAAQPETHFSQAIADVDNVPEVPTYTNVDTADVIDQIVTQARVSISSEVRSMELELNPHNLGRMLMQVSENDGQITARFLTQNESVKSALEVAITSLIEKLNDQGIKVDAVEVSVGTHEFEQNLEESFAGDAREDLSQNAENERDNRGGNRGGIHLGDPSYMEGVELTEEEQLQASIMRTYGNTVNFTA